MRYFTAVRFGNQVFKGVIQQKNPVLGIKSNFCSLRSQQNIYYTKKEIPWIKIALGLSAGGLLLYDGVIHNFTCVGSATRFLRSVKIVSLISYDYLWLILREHGENYEQLLKEVHLKSANRILKGCRLNGGLYIKVGQGVAAVNHILPEEYTSTLCRLQDECLPSTRDEVKKSISGGFWKSS